VAGRFTLDPTLPDGAALPELVALAYEDARRRGIRVCYTETSPHLVPFYEHLGYRRYTDALLRNDTHATVPLLLLLGDRGRLARVGSPLAQLAGAHDEDTEAAGWFAETYPGFVDPERPVELPDDVFFDLLAARLASEPMHSVTLLQGLTAAESERLLACTTIVQAQPGDHIVRQGEPGDALFVMLAGVAEVRREESPDFPMALVGAGDVFGEMAFLTARRRTADVVARTRCEVIVLSGDFLKAFLAEDPATAAKVLFNLARLLALRLAEMTRDAAMLA
jgi:CRP-like cAMP-binding protein